MHLPIHHPREGNLLRFWCHNLTWIRVNPDKAPSWVFLLNPSWGGSCTKPRNQTDPAFVFIGKGLVLEAVFFFGPKNRGYSHGSLTIYRNQFQTWSTHKGIGYFMAGQPTLPQATYPPKIHKGLIAGLIKGHQWLIRPAISGGGTWPGEVGWLAMNISWGLADRSIEFHLPNGEDPMNSKKIQAPGDRIWANQIYRLYPLVNWHSNGISPFSMHTNRTNLTPNDMYPLDRCREYILQPGNVVSHHQIK